MLQDAKLNDSAVRRSRRVIAMVHELHKQGYQQLVIYSGMSPGDCHWRCKVFAASCLLSSSEGGVELHETEGIEFAEYSSGDSNRYFEWDDAKSDTARDLAKKFTARFPRLCEAGWGESFEYAGWLTYVLGQSEKGHLPLMYADTSSYASKQIGSTQGASLTSPPLRFVFSGRDFKYVRFILPRRFVEDRDWHTAYIGIIDEMIRQYRGNVPVYMPTYPIRCEPVDSDIQDHCLYEIGAYWEGAIYFIQEILGYTDIAYFLSDYFAGSFHNASMWRLFHLTWDSRGQLRLLMAYLSRYALSNVNESDPDHLKSRRYEQLTEWLRDFEQAYPNGIAYPNPYFGGENPLHLGMILDSNESGEKLLFT